MSRKGREGEGNGGWGIQFFSAHVLPLCGSIYNIICMTIQQKTMNKVITVAMTILQKVPSF